MSEAKRVAVITGSYKGLGLETGIQLVEKGLQVILTSRDRLKGEPVAAKLKEDGIPVDYHQLDVTNPLSISELTGYVRDTYGHWDVLVNNAGIFPDADSGTIFNADLDIIRHTLNTNTLGALNMAQVAVPFMKANNYGRIVNVSSGMGQLDDMGGQYASYRISKTALNAVTRILNAELVGTNILVNSVCPGWVRTDMGGSSAARSVQEGADTIVWLATLADGSPSGGFFRDRQSIPW
ncbi:short-chain dehydrogenase/reductase SDR [Thalassoporum mexicanum PCC 7367]|uniref:SDR family oxidoreductase n=1 Tax=Thalassoporum mexicanum TaxID=3457544 RepID=UPI00029FD833|nr:SDR family oxidoreductase [Pseudanabaena sp. PCC 7367]AFY71807.1 short-chain dehydrogenase/reductase SDR [Pseudanabaena sp. PCC 7367]